MFLSKVHKYKDFNKSFIGIYISGSEKKKEKSLKKENLLIQKTSRLLVPLIIPKGEFQENSTSIQNLDNSSFPVIKQESGGNALNRHIPFPFEGEDRIKQGNEEEEEYSQKKKVKEYKNSKINILKESIQNFIKNFFILLDLDENTGYRQKEEDRREILLLAGLTTNIKNYLNIINKNYSLEIEKVNFNPNNIKKEEIDDGINLQEKIEEGNLSIKMEEEGIDNEINIQEIQGIIEKNLGINIQEAIENSLKIKEEIDNKIDIKDVIINSLKTKIEKVKNNKLGINIQEIITNYVNLNCLTQKIGNALGLSLDKKAIENSLNLNKLIRNIENDQNEIIKKEARDNYVELNHLVGSIEAYLYAVRQEYDKKIERDIDSFFETVGAKEQLDKILNMDRHFCLVVQSVPFLVEKVKEIKNNVLKSLPTKTKKELVEIMVGNLSRIEVQFRLVEILSNPSIKNEDISFFSKFFSEINPLNKFNCTNIIIFLAGYSRYTEELIYMLRIISMSKFGGQFKTSLDAAFVIESKIIITNTFTSKAITEIIKMLNYFSSNANLLPLVESGLFSSKNDLNQQRQLILFFNTLHDKYQKEFSLTLIIRELVRLKIDLLKIINTFSEADIKPIIALLDSKEDIMDYINFLEKEQKNGNLLNNYFDNIQSSNNDLDSLIRSFFSEENSQEKESILNNLKKKILDLNTQKDDLIKFSIIKKNNPNMGIGINDVSLFNINESSLQEKQNSIKKINKQRRDQENEKAGKTNYKRLIDIIIENSEDSISKRLKEGKQSLIDYRGGPYYFIGKFQSLIGENQNNN